MRTSVRSLVVIAAAFFVAASAAHADTLGFYAADFASSIAADPSLFSDPYSQDGFSVTTNSSSLSVLDNVNQGDPKPALSGGSDSGACGGALCVATITISDGGGLFTFGGFQLDAIGTATSYLITGFGGPAFSQAGSDSGTAYPGTYTTINSTSGTDTFTSVTIQLTDQGASTFYYLDNIAVAPEPNSLMLLGTGLIGLGAFARRRFAR